MLTMDKNLISKEESLIIIGAGPAGLAAAYEATQNGITPVVFEKSCHIGGISRTENYKDFYFDIGGHRFFTKNKQINDLWANMLGKDFIKVSRKSSIYYNGLFFNYPLNLLNALINLGFAESIMVGLSYIKAQMLSYGKEESFEQWVSNRFGQRLYETFFKSYTEKVWGIPCSDINADWAIQRIRGMSLIKALSNAIFGHQNEKTLIEEFGYPVYGPGMMWNCFHKAIESSGGRVLQNAQVIEINHNKGRIAGIAALINGAKEYLQADNVISSMPITKLVNILNPKPPEHIIRASLNLSYRSFIIVILIINKKNLFPDQWIYIHSPEVKVGRIQNFKNWSAEMVPDQGATSIGMEYFCSLDDEIWDMPDEKLIEMAVKELSKLGLAEEKYVTDSYIVRQPDAYPVYDPGYSNNLMKIRKFLDVIGNFQTIGRSGMHRYNNMDHSMLTGMLAVKNILGEKHNLWEINEEKEYLEEDSKINVIYADSTKIIEQTFAKLDKFAFASAVGIVFGILLFLATFWLVIKGGRIVGPNLELLSQYFFGYTVSVKGSFIAFVYGFCWSFLFGWLFAYFRNFATAFYIFWIKKKAELKSFRIFFDYL